MRYTSHILITTHYITNLQKNALIEKELSGGILFGIRKNITLGKSCGFVNVRHDDNRMDSGT